MHCTVILPGNTCWVDSTLGSQTGQYDTECIYRTCYTSSDQATLILGCQIPECFRIKCQTRCFRKQDIWISHKHSSNLYKDCLKIYIFKTFFYKTWIALNSPLTPSIYKKLLQRVKGQKQKRNYDLSKKYRKELSFCTQTEIFWSQYLCSLMVQTYDILNLDYFIYKY